MDDDAPMVHLILSLKLNAVSRLWWIDNFFSLQD